MPSSRPTILLTRPRAQSEHFAQACRARLGNDPAIVVSPLLAIRFRNVAVNLTDIAAIIATSSNGVEALARQADLTGRDAFCVGDATSAAAEAAGMRAVSAKGDAAALIELVRAERPQGPLFYARGAEVRTDIAAALSDLGIEVRSVVLYDQVQTELNSEAMGLIRGLRPVVLPLFSPRSAALASESFTSPATRVCIAAISKPVADAWTGPQPEALAIARRPDSDAMIDAVARLYLGASS